MSIKRRSFMRGLMSVAGAATAQTAAGSPRALSQQTPRRAVRPTPPGACRFPDTLGRLSSVTPDIPEMSWRLEDGVRVIEIAAEPVRTKLLPGRVVDAWASNH